MQYYDRMTADNGGRLNPGQRSGVACFLCREWATVRAAYVALDPFDFCSGARACTGWRTARHPMQSPPPATRSQDEVDSSARIRTCHLRITAAARDMEKAEKF